MTKSEYAQLLLDPRWNEVRKRIIHRDNLTCRFCKAQNCRLNVHHKIYVTGKMPWEIPDRFLITLCDTCHSKAHEGRLISSFIRDRIPPRKKKRENRKKGKDKHKGRVWVVGKGWR